jgi:hypothetical protein
MNSRLMKDLTAPIRNVAGCMVGSLARCKLLTVIVGFLCEDVGKRLDEIGRREGLVVITLDADFHRYWPLLDLPDHL